MEDSGEYSYYEESLQLSKNEIINKLATLDTDLTLIYPEKVKSPIWERFRIICYKNVKQNVVQCVGNVIIFKTLLCYFKFHASLLLFSGCKIVLVYKSRTGTGKYCEFLSGFDRNVFRLWLTIFTVTL